MKISERPQTLGFGQAAPSTDAILATAESGKAVEFDTRDEANRAYMTTRDTAARRGLLKLFIIRQRKLFVWMERRPDVPAEVPGETRP